MSELGVPKWNCLPFIYKNKYLMSTIFYMLSPIYMYSETDKEGIWGLFRDNFCYFSTKTYVVGTH